MPTMSTRPMPEIRPGVATLMTDNVVGVVTDLIVGETAVVLATDGQEHHIHPDELEAVHDDDPRVELYMAFVDMIRLDFDLPD